MKTKLTQKLKHSALSIVLAITMMLSANFSSIFTMANFARHTSSYANAVYSASNEKSYTFASDDKFTYVRNGNSSNYEIDLDANIIDAYNSVKNKKYFPIVKYNGFSALSEIRNELSADDLKSDVDNYYGVISTNNYSVASKQYTKIDKDYVYESVELSTTLNEGTADVKIEKNDVNVIYVSFNTSNPSADDIQSLTNILEEINQSKTITDSKELYVYLDKNTESNPSYDSSDFDKISTDSEQYKNFVAKDLENKQINNKYILSSGFSFHNRRTFEYTENTLAIKTSNTITLTSNSHYAVSVWVYTAGDATASLVVAGTNLYGKVENINTNGLWVQYYLFIETPATDNTNVTVSLYYGDDNGVTGPRSFQSYNKGPFDDSEIDDYKTLSLTGTVAFDQLKIDTINQQEYVNQTINGHSYKDIAVGNIAKGYSIDGADNTTKIENSKEATQVITGEGTQAVTTYKYEHPAHYSSVSELSNSSYYSARNYKPSISGVFDPSFQDVNGQTNANLVYNSNNTSTLDHDTYIANGINNMFTYYLPRYTADDTTTPLTNADINTYRNMYADSELLASVLPEGEAFEPYDKDKVDIFGNKVDASNPEGDNKYEQDKNVTNNTFIPSPNATNYILKLQNDSSYTLGLTTTAIDMPANAFYRVSVWAYSDTNEAVATAKLFSTVYERNSAASGTLVLATATATDFEYNGNSTNGWKELSFTVQGNPSQSTKLYLSLLASGNDTVYFDNIKVENISSNSYSAGENKLNLADKAVLTSKVTNGLFNNITVNSSDPINTYPYTASSWTIDKTTSDSVISGVVNTNEDVFNQIVPAYDENGELDYYDQNYIVDRGQDGLFYTKETPEVKLIKGTNYLVDYKGDLVKATTIAQMFDTDLTNIPVTTINDLLEAEGLPGYTDPADNKTLPESNVYAVYLPEPADAEETNPSFLLKSNSISSMSANKVVKLTFQAWIDENFEGKLVAKLVYDSKNVTDIELNIDENSTVTPNTWQTFTIYIRTGNTSRSSISLQLGATESVGTLYFQNVNYTTLADLTDADKTASDQFEDLLAAYPTVESRDTIENGKVKYVRFVDLQTNNFTMHSTKQDSETYLYESYGYNLASKGSSDKYTQGTLAVVQTKQDTTTFMYKEQPKTISQNANTTIDTALLIKNENTTDYTVANSLFNNSLSTKKYYKLTFDVMTSDDMGDNGLTVTANGLSESFKNINTTGVSTNNGWDTYTMYISVGSSSISSFSLSFKLGTSDENSYTGWALVSNINLVEIEEETYTTDTETDEIKNSDKVIIKQLKTTTDETDEEETEENEFAWATFFLVFSSVLLVVSLVVALVAVAIKKKAKKNAPDAASTGGIEANDKQDNNGGIE